MGASYNHNMILMRPVLSCHRSPSTSLSCPYSLHSRFCFFSLGLPFPRLLTRIAPRQNWTGYECFLSNLLWTLDGLVQAYNSIYQNPCEVAANMESTCSEGCEYSHIHLAYTDISISPLEAFTIEALPSGYFYGGPNDTDHSNLCECNTVTYSLISACAACQGAGWISYVSLCHCQSSLTLLPLGGLTG